MRRSYGPRDGITMGRAAVRPGSNAEEFGRQPSSTPVCWVHLASGWNRSRPSEDETKIRRPRRQPEGHEGNFRVASQIIDTLDEGDAGFQEVPRLTGLLCLMEFCYYTEFADVFPQGFRLRCGSCSALSSMSP